LSATAEALEWRNDALESPDPPRKGQRVIIYPKDLWSLEEVLATGQTADMEDGHEIACQRILAAANQFELTPTFLKEDSEAILSDPKKAQLVPQWMCMAEQVAIGGRSRVLEDGPDTPNSDDEAKEDVSAPLSCWELYVYMTSLVDMICDRCRAVIRIGGCAGSYILFPFGG
jgi:hypothetical protein